MSNAFLALDDERLALASLVRCLEEAEPGAEVRAFAYTRDALKALEDGFRPMAAFLDIQMPGELTGLELGRRIRELAPRTNLVFVTGYDKYASEAYLLHASGYVVKPVTAERVREELDNLRYAAATTAAQGIVAQCFGNFEVFVNGVPVAFSRAKSKELLAYLVDRRGASCTASELAAVLWPDGAYDRSRQKQLSVYRADMLKSLKSAGAIAMVDASWDALRVVPEAFACDFYAALAGEAGQGFLGEYMSAYPWGEETAATLTFRGKR